MNAIERPPVQGPGAPEDHLPSAERYAVKHERIAVAGVADLRIRSLLDRQQFADPLGEAERLGISSAAWPLFGLLWPSGMRLAELMGQRPVVQGERILEIGCGLGLASLVCQRAGADITASDCHPMARSFMRHNLRLNDLPPLPYRHGHWTDLLHGPAPHAPSGHKCVSGQFDLIIGADVLYERDDAGASPPSSAATAPSAPRFGSSTPNAATAHRFTAAWLHWVLRWRSRTWTGRKLRSAQRTGGGGCGIGGKRTTHFRNRRARN